MKPEATILLEQFDEFCKADPRLRPVYESLTPLGKKLIEQGFSWIPETKPAYFHQWFCRDDTPRKGLTQREAVRIHSLALMFLEKVARGRYYVPIGVEEDGQEIAKKAGS